MKENLEQRAEMEPKIPVVSPAIETFLRPTGLENTWAKELSHNKEFLGELESRRVLNERLTVVIDRLPRPDVSLQEAVEQHCLTEGQIEDLYTSVSDLLETYPEYRRILLYLPFEFLPDSSWKPASDTLRPAMERFKDVYMNTWKRLLSIQDVRANFVDGDVMEVELRTGDLPRVVKAAHLIPKLVEKGLMTTQEVSDLKETTEDNILKQSITETLPVLADLGFFPQETQSLKKEIPEIKPITLESIQARLGRDFAQIDTEEYETKKRTAWMRQEKKRKSIEAVSEGIKTVVVTQTFGEETAKAFLAPDVHLETQKALVEGIRKAIEEIAHTDTEKAKRMYEQFHGTLINLWKEQETFDLRESLSKTFRRLYRLDVVDEKELRVLDISLPTLEGPFSENLKLMKKELREINDIAHAIEKDPELSKYVYPIILLFGSRLKYGSQNSDIDVAVFVKPGTPMEQKEEIRNLLKRIFIHERIEGDAVQFWLETSGDTLTIRNDLKTSEPFMGERSWTHVLFGAAWEGNTRAIQDMRKKLLVPYLTDDPTNAIHGRQARGLYLEELERDTLQYRLMHKGYERFFPSYGGIQTPHADQIDGQSMFWDSGYRQTATKLFVRNVFLPKVSKEKGSE
ncbi:nucleotidyltransferase domain-containing protein [Candidatus Uhrbacteria bacterium]|nr:nucleotidyltransferase domain-containing protein [Candidatus Uhrbacteria bacterium]